MVVWDREDCLREANSKLSNKDLYRELKGDGRGFLSKVIESVFGKIRNRVDINDKTLHYFYVKRWLSKIHKRLQVSAIILVYFINLFQGNAPFL